MRRTPEEMAQAALETAKRKRARAVERVGRADAELRMAREALRAAVVAVAYAESNPLLMKQAAAAKLDAASRRGKPLAVIAARAAALAMMANEIEEKQ